MPRNISLYWAVSALLLSSVAVMAQPATLVPQRDDGKVVLFDAGRHRLDAVRNYTARWKKGSDLVPVAKQVRKDDHDWIEFAFQGTRGMACSTFYFEKLPPAEEGRQYQGVELVIDCDRDDYPHIGITVAFSDRTQLSCDLTLERGTHNYVVESGFRRAKHPPRWELLHYVMLTLDAARHTTDVTYRLRQITLRQVAARKTNTTSQDEVPDLFSEPVLLPEPKQVRFGRGHFPAGRPWTLMVSSAASDRTRRTAEIFADRYYGFTGHRLSRQSSHAAQPPAAGIVLQVGGPTGQSSLAAVTNPQGYSLLVEPQRVVISGADEPGLYYGTVTFFQLMRHAVKRSSAEVPIRCVAIRDWPDTLHRLIRLEHPHTFRNFPVRENRGIDYLIDWTDRFVAGNKFNTLFIDLSANVRYRRRPEMNGSEKIYSLDDLRRFGRFCRDHFIDLCPAWQVGGHANWWLTIGYHPELREKGWTNQADVTDPDHDPIVYDCMLDVIEALEPHYVSPKSDEWWHKPHPEETPDPLLHDKPRAQAFLDFHVKLNAWLKQRGLTMIIFHDMLSPYHNGKRFDTYRVIDAFPKDVIIAPWSGRNVEKEIRYFTERGFRVWPNATGMLTLSEQSKSRVMGFGKGIYSFGNDKVHLLDEYSPLWSLSNVLRVADYAWNLAGEENTDAARLVAAQQLMCIRPNPHAGDRVEPIDLAGACATTFAAFLEAARPDAYRASTKPIDLPTGEQQIGFLPMRLATGGNDCIVLRKNSSPVTLPVAGRFSSLVFLHTAFVHDPEDKAVAGVRIRQWMYGWPCGHYVVHYADGSRAVLPVRLTNNVKRLDTAAATRAALEVRYTWTLRDANGRPVHLFQWEWINPKPEQPIEKVVVEHDNVIDVSLLLFAISGRSVREE